MHRLRGLPRVFPLLWAVGGLGVSGVLAGCGPDGVQSSQSEPTETKAESGIAPKLKSSKLPKNVNPNASNRGIKGKYAD